MENVQQSFNSEQSLTTSWYPVWIMRSRGKRRACQKLTRDEEMKRILQTWSVSRLYLTLSTRDHFSFSTISDFQWQACKQSLDWENGNNAGKCLFQFWYEYLSFYNACAVADSPEYYKIFDLLLTIPQRRSKQYSVARSQRAGKRGRKRQQIQLYQTRS